MDELNALLSRFERLPEKEKALLIKDVKSATKNMRWVPLPGPQTDAYLSKADILFYGGQAGSGKSGLLVGLHQEHQKAIIFRRESAQTDGLVAYAKETIGDSAKYNGQDNEFTWTDGRSLKFAGMKEADDWMKHAGRERDYIGFDEGAEFLVSQVISMFAWNRGPKNQRCRLVIASNPPRSAEGLWVLEWFAPWLDKAFHKPAIPGELRYAVLVAGKPKWVDGPNKVSIEGIEYKPISLTFIPASLHDNPFRDTEEYRSRLNSLHEPLRSQLLYGDFSIGLKDKVNQLIPTEWVLKAKERWTKNPPHGIPMCAIGVDVAQGGEDRTVLACRHDGWYAPLIEVPGAKTPGGRDVSGLVIANRKDFAIPVIDMGGGYGGAAFEHLTENGIECIAFKGSEASSQRTRDGQLKFANKRTEAYWRFREALDPNQMQGSPIMLPDDPELVSDLTAPTFKDTSHGIQMENKEDLVKRIGRSPDKGDAVVMAWTSGGKMMHDWNKWEQKIKQRDVIPNVVFSQRYQHRNVVQMRR